MTEVLILILRKYEYIVTSEPNYVLQKALVVMTIVKKSLEGFVELVY